MPLRFLFILLLSLAAFEVKAQSIDFEQKLVAAALERTTHKITYDGSYFSIDYPNGDIPEELGVCTDVVIRSYRALGIDLQKNVHEDMKANFHLYPKIWGLKKPDKNIDHRRVPNLRVYFSRHGESLPVTDDPKDYQAGDIVTWHLSGSGIPHIGIVTDKYENDHPLIVHNIGAGPKLENMLFNFKITGHYRYKG